MPQKTQPNPSGIEKYLGEKEKGSGYRAVFTLPMRKDANRLLVDDILQKIRSTLNSSSASEALANRLGGEVQVYVYNDEYVVVTSRVYEHLLRSDMQEAAINEAKEVAEITLSKLRENCLLKE
ncbi:MAG: hypothetical protein ACP5TL_00550 [Candidatus Micrarchaeia archaeon]